MTSDSIKSKTRYEEIRNVTVVGIIVNVLLSVAQITGGLLSHSQALLADGIHTLSDLASDFVVLIAAKIASKDADEDHPYGHGRFETVGTVVLGLALTGVAIGIAFNSILRLINHESLIQPEPFALFFVALAIISKEGLYQYTIQVGKRLDSKLLLANAWHHRSDAISSLIVAIGVAGSIFLKIPWLDSAAAILVAMMIFYMGVRLIFDSTMELVDTALEPEKVEKITQLIGSLEGVEQIHMLRTRKMGNLVLADVHVQVNSYISVSEGHYIAEFVMQKLRNKFPEVSDITVHIDPEDDETSTPSNGLPSRNEVIKDIFPLLQSQTLDKDIRNIVLHYVDGKIEIEIFLKNSHHQEKIAALKQMIISYEYIRSASIFQLAD
ncbi:MAG: cation diffusion facilitator family transporter [Cocleimonas sp.]